MELILFLAVIYLFTFVVGILLEKIRIPWIFAALILGLIFAFFNPFTSVVNSTTFEFLAKLGMYFFLFLIGFEIDLKKIWEKGRFILKATFTIILFEAFLGTLFIHFVFGTGWIIAAIVALAFATVGEAMLLPILDEFDLIKTDLGQMIIGIGTLDDLIEIFVVILVVILLGVSTGKGHFNIFLAFGSLVFLFLLAFGLTKLRKEGRKLKVLGIEGLFLFVMFIFFLFIGIGKYAEAAAFGALLSGIALKNFVPEKRLELIETDLKSVAYGLFGPLFFLWVGADVTFSYSGSMATLLPWLSPVFVFVFLVVAKILLVKGAKISSSYLVGRNVLGAKKSILMGIALAVKFSTSIVIIKLLFEQSLIGNALYSVLIASTIGFKFIVPFLLSYLIKRWEISPSKT